MLNTKISAREISAGTTSLPFLTGISTVAAVRNGKYNVDSETIMLLVTLTARLSLLLALALTATSVAHCQYPDKATPCQLKSDPGSYNHKLVEVTGFVSHGFEDFTLFDPTCPSWPDVWLEYGGRVASGTMYCCGATDSRVRPQELKVEKIAIPLADNEPFRTFDKLVQRGPDSVLHATIVGRFFAGSDVTPGNSLRGYGHMGCCSLLAIQQVLSVDAQDQAGLDYRACPDESRIDNARCSYRRLIPTSAYSDLMEAQKVAESSQRDWAINDPQRVARDSLAGLLKIDELSIQRIKQIGAAQGRFVYEWKPSKKNISYVIVVSRPYWLSFYSKDSKKVAWVAIAAWELACG